MNSDNFGELKSQISGRNLPSLPALRCFEAAARLESFSRAADELHLTHGAISRAVRSLEDELDLQLFERRNRRVFLTSAGRELAMAVAEGLHGIARAVKKLRDARAQPALTVSCEPTLLMRWLIPRLPEFQSQHPAIAVHLVAGGGPVDLGGEIDLAIRRNDFVWPAALNAEPLFREAIGPVCRADRIDDFFAGQHGAQHSLHHDAPLLQSKTRLSAWQDWSRLTGQNLSSRPMQSFEHFYFSLEAAIAGIGVAIGPKRLVEDSLANGLLAAPCGFVEDGSSYHLLSTVPLEKDQRHRAFYDFLKAMLKRI